MSKIVGGFQVSSTFEWQPGPLLNWGNLFFTGDLDNISADPTLNRWFNIDAGFEKDPAKVPAGFQKRLFPVVIDGAAGGQDDAPEFERSAELPDQRAVPAGSESGRGQRSEPISLRGSEPRSDFDAVWSGHADQRYDLPLADVCGKVTF